MPLGLLTDRRFNRRRRDLIWGDQTGSLSFRSEPRRANGCSATAIARGVLDRRTTVPNAIEVRVHQEQIHSHQRVVCDFAQP